ncbi:MAG: DNA-formamidopyrimidine glycosylase family protein [Thermodesulfobacteriota bacterium]
MPELPDVQVFKELFDATWLDKRIAAVLQCDGMLLEGVSLGGLRQRLTGHSFRRTERHGKHLFACLDAESCLVLQLGPGGFLAAFRDGEKAPDHSRLLLRFEDGQHLAYCCRLQLGRISLAASVEAFIASRNLGPDALALCSDQQAFAARLAGHHGALRTLLTNQKVLAGIGNAYADEILFHLGLHPRQRAADLRQDERRELAATTRHVLETAIDNRAGAGGWPKNWLMPRREDGQHCPCCSGTIRRTTVAGRDAYFCSCHQDEAR